MANLKDFSDQFTKRLGSDPVYREEFSENVERNRRMLKMTAARYGVAPETFDDDTVVMGMTEFKYLVAKLSSLENSEYGKENHLNSFFMIFGFENTPEAINEQIKKALTDSTWELKNFNRDTYNKYLSDHTAKMKAERPKYRGYSVEREG